MLFAEIILVLLPHLHRDTFYLDSLFSSGRVGALFVLVCPYFRHVILVVECVCAVYTYVISMFSICYLQIYILTILCPYPTLLYARLGPKGNYSSISLSVSWLRLFTRCHKRVTL
jgi:hypothetical protein